MKNCQFRGDKMYETTQVPYGDGAITVIMSTESTTDVAAPAIRFGDYFLAAEECFTEKELNEISEGKNAEVRFYYVMSDDLDNEQVEEQFENAISLYQESVGSLHEGVYFDVMVTKTIGDEDPLTINSFYDEVEMQIDIPLYLSAEGREYYLMINNMGACELERDIDHDAVTLSISTTSVDTSLLLYQDQGEGFTKDEGRFQIKSQYIFISAIVVLALIWYFMDRRHRRDRDQENE